MSICFSRGDGEYYRGRAIEEQVAAQRATCTVVRERHEEMAELYRFRAMMLATAPPSWSWELAN